MKREIIDHYGAGLLSCPFCGAKEAEDVGEAWTGILLREDHRPEMWDGIVKARIVFTVHCGCCGAEISMGTREAVVEAWNRRAEPGKPTYCDKIKSEQREALARLPGLLAGL